MIEIGLSPWKKREENMLGSVASVQCTVCMALFLVKGVQRRGAVIGPKFFEGGPKLVRLL